MKKYLIPIIILQLVIIFILLYCNCKKKKDCADVKPLSPCDSALCKGFNTGMPEGRIFYATAIKMSRDYGADLGKNRVWEGNKPTDSMDALSIRFDLDKMKQYIGYIERSLCQVGCPDTTVLGLRFYYAKYPPANEMTTFEFAGLPPSFARKHTLFVVPTYWDPLKQKHIDFDPAQVIGTCQLQPISPLFMSTIGTAWGAPVIDESGSDEMNHGSLRPPPAGAGYFPEN